MSASTRARPLVIRVGRCRPSPGASYRAQSAAHPDPDQTSVERDPAAGAHEYSVSPSATMIGAAASSNAR
jgi:hypothetical protein